MYRKKSVVIILFLIFFLSNVTAAASTSNFSAKPMASNAEYKQKLTIPIDNGENAEFQPIDQHIVFKNPCWAKNPTEHSVRVIYDDGTGSTEIESQIYNLEYTDEEHISECNIVFLIPQDIDGGENYFVTYSSTETEKPDYEDHVNVEDSNYYYEPISGQKIELDYFGIRQNNELIYAVVKTGELLGNPIALAVGKLKPGTTTLETNRIEQLCSFDFRYGIKDQPGYYGTSWAKKTSSKILVDGNLMTRVRVKCTAPNGVLESDNIYTYYYQPSSTKSITVDVHHKALKKHSIEDPNMIDGGYMGIVSIKSRSATLDKMNVGEILPQLKVYSERDVEESFDFPSDPKSQTRQEVLSTKDDVDLGSKAWICLTDENNEKAHGLVLNSNKDITSSKNDGAQVKAWVKQNIKLPGLEADTGNLYLMRNAYENNEHIVTIPEGFEAHLTSEFITVENGGSNSIDKESERFKKVVETMPAVRGNISEEKKKSYSLTAYVNFAPSFPLGATLSAVTGKRLPYIYAEIYKNNSLTSSGGVNRLSIGDINVDLEGNFLQKIKTALGIIDIKNSTFFKKIRFPDLTPGRYIIKIYRENPFFGEERKYIGYKVVDVEKNSSCRIFCMPQGEAKFSVFDQNGEGIEGVNFLLQNKEVTVVEDASDKNGSADICFP
ncbi:MAG: hypothetical protein V5A64_05055, partial [Candidatus Thermoplasmatota archaeon]